MSSQEGERKPLSRKHPSRVRDSAPIRRLRAKVPSPPSILSSRPSSLPFHATGGDLVIAARVNGGSTIITEISRDWQMPPDDTEIDRVTHICLRDSQQQRTQQQKFERDWQTKESAINQEETSISHIKQKLELVTDGDEIAQVERELEIEEKKLDLRDKANRLDRRKRRSHPPESTNTWANRWIATPVAYLCPKERREEWLGDLYEIHQDLSRQKNSRWLVNIIVLGKISLFVISALKIKVSDFFLLLGRSLK
jgi:hypothetical protein